MVRRAYSARSMGGTQKTPPTVCAVGKITETSPLMAGINSKQNNNKERTTNATPDSPVRVPSRCPAWWHKGAHVRLLRQECHSVFANPCDPLNHTAMQENKCPQRCKAHRPTFSITVLDHTHAVQIIIGMMGAHTIHNATAPRGLSQPVWWKFS